MEHSASFRTKEKRREQQLSHNGFFISARPEGTKTFKAKKNLKRFQQSARAVEAINMQRCYWAQN